MTEEQWLYCTDPQPMLDFLQEKVSERKFRLFACACCRRVWAALTCEEERQAVEVAERCADELATPEERAEAYRAVGLLGGDSAWQIVSDVAAGGLDIPGGLECGPGELAASTAVFFLTEAYGEAGLDPQGAKPWACETFRCLVGNPFHEASFDPSWGTPAVLSLARAAYAQRSLPSGHLQPDRLAVLADALEDAGCAAAELLAHLRSPGPHVRGCFAVDAVLGRS